MNALQDRVIAIIATAVVSVTSVRASDERLAPVFKNLGKMLDIAYEVERYTIGHGSLPRAMTPAELSIALHGTDSMTPYLVDAWGTPYAIDSDPVKGSYTLVSAGSDREFDRATWPRREATSDPAADTVLKDGEFVRSSREWALAEFAKGKYDRAQMLALELEQSRVSRTKADLLILAIALGEYKDHVGRYPAAASIDKLIPSLQKFTKPDIPRNDAWATPFKVIVSGDGSRYRIISAGADKKLDDDDPPAKESVSDYAKDLVYANGEFLRDWKKSPPGLGAAYASFLVFEVKYKSLKVMSPEEKTRLRRDVLLSEADALDKSGNVTASIRRLQEAEKIEPGSIDRQRVLRYASYLMSNGPALPPPPTEFKSKYRIEDLYVMTDSERAEAVDWVVAELRRNLAGHPDDWPVVDALAGISVMRGHEDEAEAELRRFEARHPGDQRVAAARIEIAEFFGRPGDALAGAEALARAHPDDAQASYLAGLKVYEAVTRSNPNVTSAKKRALIKRGIEHFEHAEQLKTDHFEAIIYEQLLYRQAALLESDPARAKQLIAQADALRERASAIVKAKKAKH